MSVSDRACLWRRWVGWELTVLGGIVILLLFWGRDWRRLEYLNLNKKLVTLQLFFQTACAATGGVDGTELLKTFIAALNIWSHWLLLIILSWRGGRTWGRLTIIAIFICQTTSAYRYVWRAGRKAQVYSGLLLVLDLELFWYYLNRISSRLLLCLRFMY